MELCLKRTTLDQCQNTHTARQNSFHYMCTMSERLFLTAVREARTRVDGAHRARELHSRGLHGSIHLDPKTQDPSGFRSKTSTSASDTGGAWY